MKDLEKQNTDGPQPSTEAAKTPLAVSFALPEMEPVPINLKLKGKHRARHKARIAEAKIFARFGIQPIRLKAHTLAALGHEAEAAGIKQIGYGKVLVASDNAEEAIAALSGIVAKMMAGDEPDYTTIMEIMKLQKEFNNQVISTAQIHINADKQVSDTDKGKSISVPYPSGAPVMIAVGKQQQQ